MAQKIFFRLRGQDGMEGRPKVQQKNLLKNRERIHLSRAEEFLFSSAFILSLLWK
jgi:hypothetical protein